MPKEIVKLLSYVYAMGKRLLLLPFASLMYRNRHIWLVCERGDDARDNGYHMFRYLRREHPEIDAWYIITRESADYGKVAPLGNVAIRMSLRHWLLYIRAEKILTAFEPNFCPSRSHRFFTYMKKRQKIIFLQHGVIANDLPLYHQERSGFDLFICGAAPEYRFVSEHFNYKHNEVRYTGLARFDALHDIRVKPIVLIMPTYRKWFRDQTRQEVADSEYVRRWRSLLMNPRLTELAERYDVQVIFYPHQLMQEFVDLFSSPGSRIVIADFRHYDVQPLLMESSLLVTDYSSVHFDFAYMKKPLVYYQFDEEEVFEKHLGRGFFDYREMGFGEVVKQEADLLEIIRKYLDGGVEMEGFRLEKVEEFFPLHDRHNCERIYREILTV